MQHRIYCTHGRRRNANERCIRYRESYRCVRDHPDELCEELRYSLNSRTDFEHIREVLKSKTAIPDIKRAAYFYQIIRESYASGLDSFGAQPHNMWRNFPLITEASRRLQSVVIRKQGLRKAHFAV